MENPQTAAEWLAQFRDGELTPTHRAAFTEWLRESPANVRELLELSLLRADLGAIRISPSQLEAWAREAQSSSGAIIDGTFASQSRSTSRRAMRFAPLTRWRMLAASAAAICIAVGVSQVTPANRYSTHFGEQRTLTLEDGSVVSLNTESEIAIDLSDHVRSIKLLKGEAFFRVSHDVSRPFEVSAGDATVKAIGTQFNVRLTPAAAVVSVVDGIVEVRKMPTDGLTQASKTEAKVRLAKGEEARIRAREPATRVAGSNALRTSAWTRGRIEFEATPLVEVVAEFKRYRHLKVAIDDDAIRGIELTGSFDARDIEAVLAYIDSMPQLKVERSAPEAFAIHHELP